MRTPAELTAFRRETVGFGAQWACAIVCVPGFLWPTRTWPASFRVPPCSATLAGRWQRYVVLGRVRLQTVELGLMNDQQAEVVQGLGKEQS